MTALAGSTLVADIGGTNTRVAWVRDGHVDPGSLQRYRNAEFTGLAQVLVHHLSETGAVAPGAVCVALAGPVQGGVGQMTNLNWQISEDDLKRATGAERASILNDLRAQGYALPHLPASSFQHLSGPVPDGPSRLVVGIGTGFNIAPVSDGHVLAAEAGQIALPTPTPEDHALAAKLADASGFTALEQVISGPGLMALYQAREGAARDGADILAAHSAGNDPAATASVETFLRLLGIALGDLALCFLPLGGIYLCGGMSRAISPFLDDPAFQTAFGSKGRFSDLMAQFPLIQITDDYAALSGCARFMDG